MPATEAESLPVGDNSADAGLILRAVEQNGLADRIHAVGDGGEPVDFLFGRVPFLPKPWVVADLLNRTQGVLDAR